jgi:hypothetical protein
MAASENGPVELFPWPHLFAVQQKVYIAGGALATGLQLGLNVRPIVRCSVTPAGSPE